MHKKSGAQKKYEPVSMPFLTDRHISKISRECRAFPNHTLRRQLSPPSHLQMHDRFRYQLVYFCPSKRNRKRRVQHALKSKKHVNEPTNKIQLTRTADPTKANTRLSQQAKEPTRTRDVRATRVHGPTTHTKTNLVSVNGAISNTHKKNPQ